MAQFRSNGRVATKYNKRFITHKGRKKIKEKVMEWFNKHLNLTWLLVCVAQFGTIWSDSPIPYIIFHVCFLIITLWVLNRKGRRWVWIIIPISAPFLSNKRLAEVAKETSANPHNQNPSIE